MFWYYWWNSLLVIKLLLNYNLLFLLKNVLIYIIYTVCPKCPRTLHLLVQGLGLSQTVPSKDMSRPNTNTAWTSTFSRRNRLVLLNISFYWNRSKIPLVKIYFKRIRIRLKIRKFVIIITNYSVYHISVLAWDIVQENF